MLPTVIFPCSQHRGDAVDFCSSNAKKIVENLVSHGRCEPPSCSKQLPSTVTRVSVLGRRKDGRVLSQPDKREE